jgi:hypothetical protein
MRLCGKMHCPDQRSGQNYHVSSQRLRLNGVVLALGNAVVLYASISAAKK